ncbi:MAG: tetratricopeptide repeat protein [Cyanobacteriota/Melainabacteria group bacterium]|nr:tetratricopeptide repeat protein [Cyanobacteria bacterium HKST-UBA01]MCB9467755.1 tetratricopeptide repeat protein [Candidatus Obscuribacterales bacterium]
MSEQAPKRKRPKVPTSPWDILIASVEQIMEKGDWKESEKLALAALEEAECFEPDDRRLGITLELMSEIYYVTREYHRGAPVVRRLLQMYIRCLGPDHIDTGTVTHNAAMLYHSWGKHAEAEPFYVQALRIKKNRLGRAHPQVMTLLGHYIQLLYQTDRVKEAEELKSTAIQVSSGKFTRSGQWKAVPPPEDSTMYTNK